MRDALLVDEAVALFGRRVEARMDRAAGEAKDPKDAETAVRRVLDDALGITEAPTRSARRRRRYRYELQPGGLPRPVPIEGAA